MLRRLSHGPGRGERDCLRRSLGWGLQPNPNSDALACVLSYSATAHPSKPGSRPRNKKVPGQRPGTVELVLAERRGQVSNLFRKDLIKISEFISRYHLLKK